MRLLPPQRAFTNARFAIEVIDVPGTDAPIVVVVSSKGKRCKVLDAVEIAGVEWSPCGRFAALSSSSNIVVVVDLEGCSVVANIAGSLQGWRSVQGVPLVAVTSGNNMCYYHREHLIASCVDADSTLSVLEVGKWPRNLPARCRLLDAVREVELQNDLPQKLAVLEERFRELPTVNAEDVLDGRITLQIHAFKTAWDDVVARASPIAESSASIRSLLAWWQVRWEAVSVLHDWALLSEDEQFAPSRASAIYAAIATLNQPAPIPVLDDSSLTKDVPIVQLRMAPIIET